MDTHDLIVRRIVIGISLLLAGGLSGCDESKVESPAPLHSAATRPVPEIDLLAMGDWGEGKPAQKKVADTMATYVAKQPVKFSGLLSAGDNFYVPLKGTDDPTWQTLFEKMYDPARLDFPFYIALGNHDYDQNKFKIEIAYGKEHPNSRWKQPGKWFRVDIPEKDPLVTAIMLDSDRDFLTADEWAEENKFLASELASPHGTWTICVAHHPLFSNGAAADNGLLQKDWGTLFKKYHVDFYLCGHDHNLQHLEIPDWKTSFVLAGGGGAHSAPMIRANRGPYSRMIYGFVHFDLTPDKAIVRFIAADGTVLHVFEKTRTGDVTVTLNTASDPAFPKPLEVIQGLYDKIHPQTQPATKPVK